MKRSTRVLWAVLPLLLGTGGAAQDSRESSGIVRRGDSIYVVSDSWTKGYLGYRVPVGTSGIIRLASSGPSSPLEFANGMLPIDLEGIAIGPGDTILVLSEGDRQLLSRTRVIHTFDEDVGPDDGNRGLEGLASRPAPAGHGSEIAAVWEGGYHQGPRPPDHIALPPRLVRLALSADGAVERASDPALLDLQALHEELDQTHPGCSYRYRVPGIEWYGDGFIVLLSSLRGPDRTDSCAEEYGPKALMRFDLSGAPVGEPYLLREPLERMGDTEDRNWEGLGWWEQDHRLMMVNDDPDPRRTTVAILPLPTGWTPVGRPDAGASPSRSLRGHSVPQGARSGGPGLYLPGRSSHRSPVTDSTFSRE